MDRKDLKIQALLEKVSSLTTQYENQVADLRVELTVSQQENEATVQALMNRVAELEAAGEGSVEAQDSDTSE